MKNPMLLLFIDLTAAFDHVVRSWLFCRYLTKGSKYIFTREDLLFFIIHLLPFVRYRQYSPLSHKGRITKMEVNYLN